MVRGPVSRWRKEQHGRGSCVYDFPSLGRRAISLFLPLIVDFRDLLAHTQSLVLGIGFQLLFANLDLR